MAKKAWKIKTEIANAVVVCLTIIEMVLSKSLIPNNKKILSIFFAFLICHSSIVYGQIMPDLNYLPLRDIYYFRVGMPIQLSLTDPNLCIELDPNNNIIFKDAFTNKKLSELSGSGAAAWGSIIGTLSTQTDLQGALDGKSATTHNHDASYAPIAKGVTNGDSHDHNGGDGAQIAYSSLSGLPSIPSQYTDEMSQDAIGAMADSQSLTYTDRTPLMEVKVQMSITKDASGLKLSADSAAPGNNKAYGTDAAGVKGWRDFPAAGAHDLGGASHNADTLANLNAKISDADVVALAGQLGGTAASPDVRGLRESGGQLLTMGAVTDGQYLKRNGTTIDSGSPGGGSATGVLDDMQISVLQGDGNLAEASGVQTWAGSDKTGQDVFTVTANTTYLVRGKWYVNTGGTTHTTAMAWALGGGATVADVQYQVILWSAAANAVTTTQSTVHVSGVASKVLNATSTEVYTIIQFEGIFVVTNGGTITPQINFSANPTGTCLMKRGSWISFSKIGADTFTNTSNWQ